VNIKMQRASESGAARDLPENTIDPHGRADENTPRARDTTWGHLVMFYFILEVKNKG
jgi:hypothetical protein